MTAALPRNADVAAQLDLLADLMEVEGEDGFRIAAYRRAAGQIRETPSFPVTESSRPSSSFSQT